MNLAIEKTPLFHADVTKPDTQTLRKAGCAAGLDLPANQPLQR